MLLPTHHFKEYGTKDNVLSNVMLRVVVKPYVEEVLEPINV